MTPRATRACRSRCPRSPSAFRSQLELEARGHEGIAVRLPAEDETAGWSEYADAVVTALEHRDAVTLVAMAMGGFTAPIVCARRRVELLVLGGDAQFVQPEKGVVDAAAAARLATRLVPPPREEHPLVQPLTGVPERFLAAQGLSRAEPLQRDREELHASE